MTARSSVTVTMDSDEHRLLAGMQRVLDKERQIEAKRKQSGEAADKSANKAISNNKETEKGLGLQLQRLAALTGKYLTLGATIGAVKAVAAEFNRQQQQALQTDIALEDSRRRLAGVNRGDVAGAERRADELAFYLARGGDATIGRTRARNLAFEAGSAPGRLRPKLEALLPTIGRFEPLITAETSLEAAATLPGLFPKSDLSPEESVALLSAAAEVSRIDPEQFRKPLATAAGGGLQIGAGAVSTAATLAAVVESFPSEREAATAVQRLGVKAGMAGMRGTFPEVIGQIESMSEQEKKDFFQSNQELTVAFQKIGAQVGRIRASEPGIAAKTKQGFAGMEEALAERLGQQPIEARRRRNRAGVEAQIQQEEVFLDRALAVDEAVKRQQGRLGPGTQRAGRSLGARTAQDAGLGPTGVAVAGETVGGVSAVGIDQIILGPLFGSLKRLGNVAESAAEGLGLIGDDSGKLRNEASRPSE